MLRTFFILASTSPRRIEFLKKLQLNFKQTKSLFTEKENFLKVSPENYAVNNAYLKAKSLEEYYPEYFIAGFDTIVEIDKIILGKPKSFEHACKMLSCLSGKTHNVITGYAIINRTKNLTIKKCVKTSVTFKHLTMEEIKWYVNTKEPLDKAGAYAIQGIGSFMIKKINGSFSNVVGLPIVEFLEDLKKLTVIK